jgi:hypothetical protein
MQCLGLFFSCVAFLLLGLWPLAAEADGEKAPSEQKASEDKNAHTDKKAVRGDAAQPRSASSHPSSSPSPASDERPMPPRKTPRQGVPLRPGGPVKQPAKLPAFTAEREAAAVRFVSQHHAELKDLLVNLKTTDGKEYENAIRDLFRTSERLAQIQERGDAERYELELESWKTDSRVRLLAARLSMERDNRKLREELREELLKRIDLRLARVELDRRQMAEKLAGLDEQIARMKKQREQQADQSLQQLMKTVRRPGAGPAKDGAPPKKSLPVRTTDDKPAEKKANDH